MGKSAPNSSFPRKRESRGGGGDDGSASSAPPILDSRFRGNDEFGATGLAGKVAGLQALLQGDGARGGLFLRGRRFELPAGRGRERPRGRRRGADRGVAQSGPRRGGGCQEPGREHRRPASPHRYLRARRPPVRGQSRQPVLLLQDRALRQGRGRSHLPGHRPRAGRLQRGRPGRPPPGSAGRA